MQPGTQCVELSIRAGAGLGELQGERLAADVQAAGGGVHAEENETLGEALDAVGLRRDRTLDARVGGGSGSNSPPPLASCAAS